MVWCSKNIDRIVFIRFTCNYLRFAYILLCLIVYLLQTNDLFFLSLIVHEIFVYFFYAIWGMARLEINL